MFQMHRSIDQGLRSARFKGWSFALFTSVIICTALGCGKERYPRDPNMVPIAGVVTIDGEPTQYVRVTLGDPKTVEIASKRKYLLVHGPSGTTDEKGAFSITTTRLNDGALPGDYMVVFEWNPPGVAEDFFEEGVPPENVLKKFPPKLVAIHEKYAAGKPGNIPLKIEPKTPQKELKFDLTTK